MPKADGRNQGVLDASNLVPGYKNKRERAQSLRTLKQAESSKIEYFNNGERKEAEQRTASLLFSRPTTTGNKISRNLQLLFPGELMKKVAWQVGTSKQVNELF